MNELNVKKVSAACVPVEAVPALLDAEKIDFLYNSPEYERYEIFESYRPDIDDLYNMLKEANSYGDKEEINEIEAQLNELKKMMISDMNKTRK